MGAAPWSGLRGWKPISELFPIHTLITILLMKAGDRHSWKAHRKMFYGVKKQGETAWAGPKGPSTLPASVLKADPRQLPSQAIFKQRGFREI